MAVDTVLSVLKNRNVTRQILDQEMTLKAYIDTTETPLAAADEYPIFQYDANTYISEAMLITETVEGAADTMNVLDAASGSNLIAAQDLSSLGTGTKYTTGKLMTTAGDISLTVSAAITAWKGWVHVKFTKMKTTD